MSYSYLFKYILIGDTGVGKTCMLLQFTDKRFSHEHDMTIGVEFGTSSVTVNNESIKLQIWDTAGQETFRSITRSYYTNTAGCILVYDITRRDSFKHVSSWLEDAKSLASSTLQVMLVGNKTDLETHRQVSTEEGQNYANQHGLLFCETSAKSREVDHCFKSLAERIYQQVKLGNIDPNNQNSGVQYGLGTNKPLNNVVDHTEDKKEDKCCVIL